jgi:hypothetical protein
MVEPQRGINPESLASEVDRSGTLCNQASEELGWVIGERIHDAHWVRSLNLASLLRPSDPQGTSITLILRRTPVAAVWGWYKHRSPMASPR